MPFGQQIRSFFKALGPLSWRETASRAFECALHEAGEVQRRKDVLKALVMEARGSLHRHRCSSERPKRSTLYFTYRCEGCGLSPVCASHAAWTSDQLGLV